MALFMQRPRLGHRIYSSRRGSWAGGLNRIFTASTSSVTPGDARSLRSGGDTAFRRGRFGSRFCSYRHTAPLGCNSNWRIRPKVSIIQHELSRDLKVGTNELRHLAICAVGTDPYTAKVIGDGGRTNQGGGNKSIESC